MFEFRYCPEYQGSGGYASYSHLSYTNGVLPCTRARAHFIIIYYCMENINYWINRTRIAKIRRKRRFSMVQSPNAKASVDTRCMRTFLIPHSAQICCFLLYFHIQQRNIVVTSKTPENTITSMRFIHYVIHTWMSFFKGCKASAFLSFFFKLLLLWRLHLPQKPDTTVNTFHVSR